MWTNRIFQYRSYFMLVRIGFQSGFTLPIPIPLFLLDQTLDTVEDLVWLAEKFFWQWAIHPGEWNRNHRGHHPNWMIFTGEPTKALKLCREIIWELRCYGKWRMVEVESRDPKRHIPVRVYVDFI